MPKRINNIIKLEKKTIIYLNLNLPHLLDIYIIDNLTIISSFSNGWLIFWLVFFTVNVYTVVLPALAKRVLFDALHLSGEEHEKNTNNTCKKSADMLQGH